MFFFEHARLQGLGGIPRQDTYAHLLEQFTRIRYSAHEIVRTACYLIARGEHGFVHMQSVHSLAAMIGDERRMNVDHSALVNVQKRLGDDGKIAGKDDEIDILIREIFYDRRVFLLPAAEIFYA